MRTSNFKIRMHGQKKKTMAVHDQEQANSVNSLRADNRCSIHRVCWAKHTHAMFPKINRDIVRLRIEQLKAMRKRNSNSKPFSSAVDMPPISLQCLLLQQQSSKNLDATIWFWLILLEEGMCRITQGTITRNLANAPWFEQPGQPRGTFGQLTIETRSNLWKFLEVRQTDGSQCFSRSTVAIQSLTQPWIWITQYIILETLPLPTARASDIKRV